MDNLYVLNKVFTKNTLSKWISHESENTYNEVIKRFIYDYENKNNQQLISELYSILEKNYRNEYYYKNTLLNKLLIGVHSTNTTTALSEVSIAKSKADFILINGKAIVYEIKTELDNLERLESQIHDYYKAFDHVAVITYEDNIKHVSLLLEKLNYPIGIYVLRKNSNIGTIIKPLPYRNSLDFNEIYKILRKNEYEKLVVKFFGSLPNTTQFKYYSKCKSLLSEVEINEFYDAFIKILKERSTIKKDEFKNTPYELRFLVYFSKMKNKHYNELYKFLQNKKED